MSLSDRLRHAENTLNKYRDLTPREQELAVLRLVKMRGELEDDRDELALALDEQYEALTPERAARYPAKFEKKFGGFHQDLAGYERVCDVLGQIDRIVSDREVIGVKSREEVTQADGQGAWARNQPLFPLHGRTG